MDNVNLTIDGQVVEVPVGSTILEAAVVDRYSHPCYHPDQSIKAVCRVCVVEVEGSGYYSLPVHILLLRDAGEN